MTSRRTYDDSRYKDTGGDGYCGHCQTRIEGAKGLDEWGCVRGNPDPCLGIIPGVSHACCGHGDPENAYVVLGGEPDYPAWAIDTVTLEGPPAVTFFELVKSGEFLEGRPYTVWRIVEEVGS